MSAPGVPEDIVAGAAAAPDTPSESGKLDKKKKRSKGRKKSKSTDSKPSPKAYSKKKKGSRGSRSSKSSTGGGAVDKAHVITSRSASRSASANRDEAKPLPTDPAVREVPMPDSAPAPRPSGSSKGSRGSLGSAGSMGSDRRGGGGGGGDVADAYVSKSLLRAPQVFPDWGDRRDTEIIAMKGVSAPVIKFEEVLPSYKQERREELMESYLTDEYIAVTDRRMKTATYIVMAETVLLLFWGILTVAGLGEIWGELYQYAIAGVISALVAVLGLFVLCARSHNLARRFKLCYVFLAVIFLVFDLMYILRVQDPVQPDQGDLRDRCAMIGYNPELCALSATPISIFILLGHLIGWLVCFLSVWVLQGAMKRADKIFYAQRKSRKQLQEKDMLDKILEDEKGRKNAGPSDFGTASDADPYSSLSNVYATPPPGMDLVQERKS